MHILLLIGVVMMVPMHRSPPQRTPLHRRIAQNRKEKLPQSRGPKGAVRKITMIKSRDSKHAHQIQTHRRSQRKPAKPNPQHEQATQVNDNEGNRPLDIHLVLQSTHRLHPFWMIIRIQPLPQHDTRLLDEFP